MSVCVFVQAQYDGVVENEPTPLPASRRVSPSQMDSPGLQQHGFRHGTDHYQVRSVNEMIFGVPLHHASTISMSRHACP